MPKRQETPEQRGLREVQEIVDHLPTEERIEVEIHARMFRDLLKVGGKTMGLAYGLVGAEIAAL